MTGMDVTEKKGRPTFEETVESGKALDAWKILESSLKAEVEGLENMIAHYPKDAQKKLRQLMKIAKESERLTKIMDEWAAKVDANGGD